MGQRFGRLEVIGEVPSHKGHTQWLCLCGCDNKKIVQAGHLQSGNTKSCGCIKGKSKEKGKRFSGETMKKQQKPLGSIFQEIYDWGTPYKKRKELLEAYKKFWGSLDPELTSTLKMMLI